MPDRPQSIAPPWNEADTICETTLLVIDNPEDRDALRRVGRLLYTLAVETAMMPAEESETRRELRAAAAEARFLEGYLGMVRRSAEESSLQAEDEALARFAGGLAGRVGALAASIEGRLAS